MLTYPNIDPIAFSIGPLHVRWYGISYVVAILTAWWLCSLRARKSPSWSGDQVADLVFDHELQAPFMLGNA